MHWRGSIPLALPLGELSAQLTERALSVSLRGGTSPKERGKLARCEARHQTAIYDSINTHTPFY